jgi:hypothetical protein
MRFIPDRPVRRALGIAGSVAFGLAVTAAVSTIAGATQGAHQDDQQGGGAAVLAAEIEAMEAGGMPADDPKIRMLQDDLDALERGRDVTPPAEPGVDVPAILGDPATRDEADDAVDTSDASLWDDGAVQCEVVPPDLLTAADIAGATCASTLDGDGGSHYTATGRDGTVRTVHFAPDGNVTRAPDRHS